jgi:hypothetical protein
LEENDTLSLRDKLAEKLLVPFSKKKGMIAAGFDIDGDSAIVPVMLYYDANFSY